MIPKLFGEINDKDTQFSAALKQHQDYVLIGGVFIILFIGYLVISSFSSTPMGTWRYGVCKTFLERYVQYPPDVKVLTTGEKQNASQIGYLHTNSYGSRQSELMECFYNVGDRGVILNRVTIDRKPLDQEIIDNFNQTIPLILARDDLDLEIPERLPNTIEGLKFD